MNGLTIALYALVKDNQAPYILCFWKVQIALVTFIGEKYRYVLWR